MPAHPLRRLRRAKAKPHREIEGEAHAQRHRLAVQQRIAEAGLGLERMAEGVAEIEQRPLALLALVDGDHRGLGGAALEHRLAAAGRIAGDQPGALRLEPIEEAADRG